MGKDIIFKIHKFFKPLTEAYGFVISEEKIDDESCLIVYTSDEFGIKIENYFREIYASVFRVDDVRNEINIFNLLEYLNRERSTTPKSDYFRSEKDLVRCYEKQIAHISSTIYENYDLIVAFFNCDSSLYKMKVKYLYEYLKEKHPQLYRSI